MEKGELDMINAEKEKNQQLLVLGKKYNEINLAYNQVLSNIKAMQDYDQSHPLDLKEKENQEEEKKEENKEEKKEENNNLTQDEEDCITGYEKLLEKILKAFNILCLCKSKQEFLNLMREKGIMQQSDNKATINRGRGKQKKTTRRTTTMKTTKAKYEEKPTDNQRGEITGMLIPYFVCPRFACRTPKNPKILFSLYEAMRKYRMTWRNPFGHRSTRSAFFSQNDQNAPSRP